MKFYQLFYKSLYDLKVIAYTRLQPITKALLHVTVLALIAFLPFIISSSFTLNNQLNQIKALVETDLPEFTINSNQLHSNLSEPFVEHSDATGFLIVDPNNQYSLTELHQYGNGVALQKNNLISFAEGQAQDISYNLLGVEQMGSDQLLERISELAGFLPILLPLIGFFNYVSLLGTTFLGISLLAVLGLLLRGKRNQLQYKHLWNMSAYSLTLPVILFGWIEVFIPLSPFLLILASIAMLTAVVRKVPIPKPRKAKPTS
ncbi:hypothetical protein AJ85_20375 [Alkalihalobacillus alcalophilus ATCC 27647 = CGMCC 1.3604]|uniref:DUF1189 domain-containing protein n=1 Tax=Alkalihalobacillus alcalophilus ATCC 27647 = CGMCC 1.3604 TaxID=1218173 RepID=A0A094XB21_ALKAL|nr:DUF1189 domain-containing protein [Alkalihalobacillus alcalophilus]KGA95995.1 hypothetical protein BALCAV_0219035 [Alkalihalobacillus alcalophilus ATCC 27647 = CGMCC 1.3604]MED1561927.1 DUF1189 domain-containing protein [Alkalihalobacillus alcalophilus]THG88955.1 hypothetical protein AJ85_20375 [Alkalihalobacillus alcalophilus ATCC 27647 = CGMCC 1.3604]